MCDAVVYVAKSLEIYVAIMAEKCTLMVTFSCTHAQDLGGKEKMRLAKFKMRLAEFFFKVAFGVTASRILNFVSRILEFAGNFAPFVPFEACGGGRFLSNQRGRNGGMFYVYA